MDGFQKIKLIGFRLPRSQIRISTEFIGHPVLNERQAEACDCLITLAKSWK